MRLRFRKPAKIRKQTVGLVFTQSCPSPLQCSRFAVIQPAIPYLSISPRVLSYGGHGKLSATSGDSGRSSGERGRGRGKRLSWWQPWRYLETSYLLLLRAEQALLTEVTPSQQCPSSLVEQSSLHRFFFFSCLFFIPNSCFPPAVSVYVEAYDELLSGPVAEYVSISQQIGGDVQTHVSGTNGWLSFLGS